MECTEHGVKTIRVPWSEPGSSFSALIEALVIDWLRAANTSTVARLLGLSWDQADRMMQRAVRRGLARHELEVPPHPGVDEPSFHKRPVYVTVVAGTTRGVVQHVADARGKGALAGYYAGFTDADLEGFQSVAVDIRVPYVAATLAAAPRAENKIAFDTFQVAKHQGSAFDHVRREENRLLREVGDETLDQGHQAPMALSPGQPPRGARPAVRRARPEGPQDLLCLDAQRARHGDVEVPRPRERRGRGVLNAIVARVTNARIEGLTDPVSQTRRPGLPQPRPRPQRYLLPPRWTRPLPRCPYPLEFLKSPGSFLRRSERTLVS